MKYYRVVIKGENYLLNISGDVGKFGFLATRFVKAGTPVEAEKIAKILVCQDSDLRESIVNEGNGPPLLTLDQLKEINPVTFYFKKKKKDWMFHSEDEIEKAPMVQV
ncbi:MAG: hypothetical protein JXK94_02070 [Deltaproteobacteria bacterium]|nr:hypothetical protein [Deltaproteobacteria bacterium]